jgi:hypothetical protein
MNTTIKLGMDAGNGAYKLAGAEGFLELQSQVAMNGGQKVMNTMGLLRRTIRPRSRTPRREPRC